VIIKRIESKAEAAETVTLTNQTKNTKKVIIAAEKEF